MNELCRTRISHVTYEWVMSHMNESCHIWMSYVTYESVMSHMNESWHIWMRWMSHGTYSWVMSHMNKPCHIWMSRGTYEWDEWVMAHIHESCHIWISHVTSKCAKRDVCLERETSKTDLHRDLEKKRNMNTRRETVTWQGTCHFKVRVTLRYVSF